MFPERLNSTAVIPKESFVRYSQTDPLITKVGPTNFR